MLYYGQLANFYVSPFFVFSQQKGPLFFEKYHLLNFLVMALVMHKRSMVL